MLSAETSIRFPYLDYTLYNPDTSLYPEITNQFCGDYRQNLKYDYNWIKSDPILSQMITWQTSGIFDQEGLTFEMEIFTDELVDDYLISIPVYIETTPEYPQTSIDFTLIVNECIIMRVNQLS